MCAMGLLPRNAVVVQKLVLAPSTRLRCRSLRSLVTVVQSSSAVTQQTAGAAVVPVVAVSKGKSMPRQATASKQQQQAKVTFHKNRRSKHAMPVPSEPPPQCVPASLAQFAGCRALVLDSSYRPIDIVNWQRAICMDLFDKVDVLEYFEDVSVRSARQSHLIPAVCRVRFYVKRNWKGARMSLSRRNIMLRDRFCCQYCGARSSLTLDHVKPVSKGGKFTWENMVTACMSCNSRKGDHSLKKLGWTMRKMPAEPTASEVSIIAGMGVADVRTPPREWQNYIFPGQMPCFTAHDAPL